VDSELLALTRALAGELDPARALELLLAALVRASGAEDGAAMRWDGRRFTGAAAERFSRTVLERLRRDGRPLVYADAPAELADSRSLRAQQVRSVLAVPLTAAGELIGAVYLDHADPNRFGDGVLARVGPLAELAALALDRARRAEELAKRERELRAAAPRPAAVEAILGASAAVEGLRKTLARLIDVDYPVLIEGESGTGKELVARALHFGGRRAERAFLPANCGGLTDAILASELFGHARGAFTGAERDRPGLFEAADGGTLFLDEIEAMSPAVQDSLLRALESGEIRRVGENVPRRVDVRVIAATNAPLEKGGFRRDLFFRIAVLRIAVPPLRARLEDLPLLAGRFLETIGRELGRPAPVLKPSALERLSRHPWPGNVRELQNALKRAAALAERAELTERDFEFLGASPPSAMPLVAVDEYIRQAHAAWSGRMDDEEIARRLGISRKTLWTKRNPSAPAVDQ
jgi:transcriptional regulator with GAF, ATPase, and Fis domain